MCQKFLKETSTKICNISTFQTLRPLNVVLLLQKAVSLLTDVNHARLPTRLHPSDFLSRSFKDEFIKIGKNKFADDSDRFLSILLG